MQRGKCAYKINKCGLNILRHIFLKEKFKPCTFCYSKHYEIDYNKNLYINKFSLIFFDILSFSLKLDYFHSK